MIIRIYYYSDRYLHQHNTSFDPLVIMKLESNSAETTSNVMGYKHKVLSPDERKKFKELFLATVNNNTAMRLLFRTKWFAVTYPLFLIILLILTIKYASGFTVAVVGFVLGFLSIQLNFSTSHMWAHALMLEYQMWTIEEMLSKIGYLPIVIFYAFFHHHDEDPESDSENDPQLRNVLGYDGVHVLYSHWNSFSLFTYHYPLNGVLLKLFVAYHLCFNFEIIIGYILGYEFGVFLLPISHDWVHSRLCGAYYMLKPLEMLGIFATKEDHRSHHRHDHPTVYQNFMSSGIFSKRANDYADEIWNILFEYSNMKKIQLYKLMWYLMIGSMACSLIFSTYLLLCLQNIITLFY